MNKVGRVQEAYATSVGRPHPLGPSVQTDGVNFSVFSRNATGVELLLFDGETAPQPSQVVTLDPNANRTFGFWHVFIEGLRPGAHYGYRVDGPMDFANGHRFDRAKLAIDPYARGQSLALWDRVAACEPGDNVARSMRSVVIDWDDYDWEGDAPLGLPMQDLIIYEAHVGGMTRSPSAGVADPGTYRGLIEKIPHLQALGVTAIELLPVFEFDSTAVLRETPDGTKLRNYWGYSTIGFFAPASTYCQTPGQATHLTEFRDMVKALHRAGIEVILDVVFNHTDEGNHMGPAMCFKLLDNSVYYHLVPQDRQYYMDYSGCGNTLNCNHPVVAKMIVECLEFWVREMHIDGFRFDEGTILTRDEAGVPVMHPPVVWAIELSETLANTKIIAEAWDAGGAYQVGYFPGYRWAEWNGRFRDVVRRFVAGEPGLVGQLADRVCGSASIYQASGHMPINSINFVTCHDGFTLNDLVSYNGKHNQANGENNADGADDNNSWNCGVEGPGDAATERFRSQQVKNFAILLLLAQGVPMISGGDEIRRSQGGNNNAYCQDNAIGWTDWTGTARHADVLRFFRHAIALRRYHPMLRRARFFTGERNPRGLPDISWHGTRLGQPNWDDPASRVLAATFGGAADERDLHVMMNMSDHVIAFELPHIEGHAWGRVADTSLSPPDDIVGEGKAVPIGGNEYLVNGHSIVLLASLRATTGGSAPLRP
ncbi:Glycogen operon protein GlgX homolog [Rhodovastum atsumiense]|uniref:Glycogen debranching protein GlgX n=1 Tax=Rhodovastum atsumiense TaxID=504468 RepID=A0A5M6IM17_9PROT|nr:glycogen debranching protein GlgX [Rhodovastum atsumiense]KAA5609333.1 glycogen debranching protein GlgX [Rhodovastum atsumiense]CAH2602366.1 Glycogen operon protein GlgX homolog [Rhodovastum atsumiense]